MIKANFIECDRDVQYLLPPSIQDWLPEGHLARFVVDIVEQIDLRSLKASYAGRGSQPYSPEMLLALLFYGYATGVFSSRKLERSTHDSVAFRYIAANSHPDHDTIAAFRHRFGKEISELFVQILHIAREMNVLKLCSISLDGTKIKANASKHKALSYEYACRLEEQIKNEVAELLRKGEAADQADIPDGMSIPAELERREKRLKAIAEAKAEIERRAKERYSHEKKTYEEKIAQQTRQEQETGKKPRKDPEPPEPGPKSKDQVNLTDSESRIMPKSGGFEQTYNAQAAVDSKSMLIVANHVSQHPNDKQEMEPVLNALEKLPANLGTITTMIADCGYFSKNNVEACEHKEIIPYIAIERGHHNPSLMERFLEPPPVPDNADSVTKMKYRLKTRSGKAVYATRKTTVEPVFGIIKAVMGFRRFMLRGFKSVTAEWSLVCMAWNIKRLHVLKTI